MLGVSCNISRNKDWLKKRRGEVGFGTAGRTLPNWSELLSGGLLA
jgi:hypothetical protein